MPDGRSSALAFGPFRLFATERRLEKDGKPVRLGGRALDLLIVLVQRAGEIVAGRTLLDEVWREVNVEESSLRFHIKNLRKVLGDDQTDAQYVTNVPGRGYCFVAPVEPVGNAGAPEPDKVSFDRRPNLPVRGTVVIGRTDSIETVSRELSRRRLVTIAGAGGIGKTTLAIATAETLRAGFDDAVFFVDLAPVVDATLVVSAIASVLGLALRTDDPIAVVVDFLRDKRLLIVLDNCEQVIEAVAAIADRVLHDTARIHVLVTSREPLRIAGERVHRLMPLECPPIMAGVTAGEAMSYPAVQLLVDRATASDGDFTLDDLQAPAAAEICRRLDGIPLAIELAAARVEFFGIAGLASGLNDMFALLTQGRRFALPRHQTLRATLDWGYNHLSPAEQAVLRYIAIFRSTFTLESALAIVGGANVPSEHAIDAMANLVAKSMLTADRTGETVQYRLLETTRVYALGKLLASNEGSETARRHAEHHLYLIRTSPDAWESSLGKRWLRLYAGRIDDIRAALDWTFSPGGDPSIGFHIITDSARLWFQLSLSLEYRDRIERTLQRLSDLPQPDAVVEMRLQAALGHAVWYSAGGSDRLENAFTRALELADRIGDVPVQLQALWGMWAVRRGRGEYRQALAVATQYQAIAATAGDQASIMLSDRILGLTHHHLGDQATARRMLEKVQAVARSTGDVPNADFQLSPEVAAATLLARVYWLQGFPDQAMAALRESLDAAQRSDHWFSTFYVICLAGCPLSLWVGNLTQTRDYLDMIFNRAVADRWRQCWQSILRLRQGDAREVLIASFFEPRVDLATATEIAMLTSAPVILLPDPDDDVGDVLWSLPEVLRVNAQLLLWHGAPGAAAAAEAKLLRSLDIARQQATLSWELRTATSLARLWHGGGRMAEARDLLSATYDRFTEGFNTADVVAARQLIIDWS